MSEYGMITHPEDFDEILNTMSNEEAGILYKNMIRAFKGEDVEASEDRYLNVMITKLCGRVSRESKVSQSRSISGSIGGKVSRAKAKAKQNSSKVEANAKQNVSKSEANDKQTSSSNIPITNNQLPITNINNNIVRVIDPREEIVEDIVAYLNQAAGTHYRTGKDVTKLIHGRLNEGFTADDFKKVIDKKVKKWGKDPKMSLYIRPSTLFAPSHFNEYLNEPDETAAKIADDDMLRRWAEGG